MRTLFKGGSVASGKGVRRADLLVEGEKVVSLGRGLKAEAERIRDTVLPGMGRLRLPCDQAETLTPKKYWPFPTYGDLLFGVR